MQFHFNFFDETVCVCLLSIKNVCSSDQSNVRCSLQNDGDLQSEQIE